MPSTSKKQARFMKAVAHGWKPTQATAPPVGVAQEFVAADQAVGMYEGGLAPMNDMMQRGFAPGLTGMSPGFQGGGEVEVIEDYGGLTDEQIEFLKMDVGTGDSWYANAIRKMQNNFRATHGLSAPAVDEPTGVPPVATAQGPRGRGGRGRGGGGGRGRGGGGGGIGADDNGDGPWPQPDDTCESGFRGRAGNCRPVGTTGPGDDGRIIPPTTPPIDYTPPDPRAGRDTEYADAIRAHKLRVAASLAVPPGGYAEGGAARAGHHEDTLERGPNPHKKDSASYNYWERRYHADPPPPPPPPPEEEEVGWLAGLLGKKRASETRTEEELAEMEQSYGGYVEGYANGGLASLFGSPRGGVPPSAGGDMSPRRGGVPPQMRPQPDIGRLQHLFAQQQQAAGGGGDPRSMPPQPYGGGGGMPGPYDDLGGGRNMTTGGPMGPVGMKDPRTRMAPPPGKDPRSMPPQPWGGSPPPRAMPGGRRGRIDPRGVPVPRGMPPDRGGPGPQGGPQMPQNMRGMLQKMRMSNRPRRGFSGPAGAGGPPNRVGMSDQQGGLARALQRGTGRPPMSRRSGSFQ